MGLADDIINKTARPKVEHVDIEDVPDLILQKHPSIYRIKNDLYWQHERIRPASRDQILLLADNHYLKLTPAQSAWVYNRLLERAPNLEDDFIVVSRDYAWSKKTGQLIPLKNFTQSIITPNERTTNGRMGQSAELQANGESVSGSTSASD